MSRAVIFGCAGPKLSDDERALFRRVNPVGLILFARNCVDPSQVAALVADFKATVAFPDPLILIDQEGGRVQRLGPPNWSKLPAAERIAALAEVDADAAENAALLLGRLLAADLAPLGITVDCAPVLDIRRPDTHDVIGDRAFGGAPGQVARLGRAVCEGLLAGGVLPVIKHIPGHGRARADSHKELPVIGAALNDLAASDFAPFRALRDMPLAMSAHVVLSAVDAAQPVSTSKTAIERLVRGAIGFGGLLMSDDIGMQALAGDMGDRTRACQRAGCDLILHCSGDRDEMEAVARTVRPTTTIAERWLVRAEQLRRDSLDEQPFDSAAARRDFDALLARAGGE